MLHSTRRRLFAVAALVVGSGLLPRKSAAQERVTTPAGRAIVTVGSWRISTWGVTATATPTDDSVRMRSAQLPSATERDRRGGGAELTLEYVYNRPPDRAWEMKLVVSEQRGGLARLAGGGSTAVIAADGVEIARLEVDRNDGATWDPRSRFGPQLERLDSIETLSAALLLDGQTLPIFEFHPAETKRALSVMEIEAGRSGRAALNRNTTPFAQEPGAQAGGQRCFITAACCETIGLDDDCFELKALRRFRDDVLARLEGGTAEIATYYRVAPAILDEMARRGERDRLLAFYFSHVLPSAALAGLGAVRLTRSLYRDMMRRLAARYLQPAATNSLCR